MEVHKHAWTLILTRVCACTHTHTHLQTHIHSHMHAHTHTCLHTTKICAEIHHANAQAHSLSKHTCTQTHKQTHALIHTQIPLCSQRLITRCLFLWDRVILYFNMHLIYISTFPSASMNMSMHTVNIMALSTFLYQSPLQIIPVQCEVVWKHIKHCFGMCCHEPVYGTVCFTDISPVSVWLWPLPQ